MTEYKIELQNDALMSCLDSEDMQQLHAYLSFDRHPQYFTEGRTGYYGLNKPIRYQGRTYTGMKIKGVGNGSPKTNHWEFPGLRSFEREDPHFGFDPFGKTIRTYSDDAPFGGITLSRATREYENLLFLFKNGINCLMPLMVGRYCLKYRNENLGFVVSLCQDYPPIRMNQLLIDPQKLTTETSVYFNAISRRILDADYDSKTQWDVCKYVAKRYADEVRKLNEAGLCIHSGGWSNIQFSLREMNVVLIDLDSTRRICMNPRSCWALYAVRDLVSNIYRLLINLYHPSTIVLLDENKIRKTNLVEALLSGYFWYADLTTIGQISGQIIDYYMICFLKIKSIESIMDNISRAEQKKYELDMFAFYDYCLRLLYPLFLQENSELINESTLQQYNSALN